MATGPAAVLVAHELVARLGKPLGGQRLQSVPVRPGGCVTPWPAAAAAPSNGVVRLSWEGRGGRTYEVEDAPALPAPAGWTNRAGAIGAVTDAVFEVSRPESSNRFFRLRVRLSDP